MQGARTMPAVNLRMPPELKDWLTEQAQRNFRSLSAEIVMRLAEARRREAASGEQSK
ncbi:Arc family DNA-binding protein [Cupriavidus sp. JZ107]